MATVGELPAGMPPPSTRPSSGTLADVYGSLTSGTPTLAAGGSIGGARVAAAAASDEAGAPVTIHGLSPELLHNPAGVLLILVAALAILSWLDL